jgi:hypothetical protein
MLTLPLATVNMAGIELLKICVHDEFLKPPKAVQGIAF